MTDPNQGKACTVQDIFTRIASRYDLMNRLMSLGQDRGWRRAAIRQAALPPGGYLLDLGSGTGDMSIETLRQYLLGLLFVNELAVPRTENDGNFGTNLQNLP